VRKSNRTSGLTRKSQAAKLPQRKSKTPFVRNSTAGLILFSPAALFVVEIVLFNDMWQNHP
jgi:hypothetical protein